jgi:hypothetical protein
VRDLTRARGDAVRIAVQAKGTITFALDDPRLTRKDGALSEQPPYQRQVDRIGRGLDKHFIFLKQIPTVPTCL